MSKAKSLVEWAKVKSFGDITYKKAYSNCVIVLTKTDIEVQPYSEDLDIISMPLSCNTTVLDLFIFLSRVAAEIFMVDIITQFREIGGFNGKD